MRYILIGLLLFSFTLSAQQPTLSFTVDDGNLGNSPIYTFEEWNGRLLAALDSAGVQAAFFVRTKDMDSEKGQHLLQSWDAKGHLIANHTYSHPYFNGKDNTARLFEYELLKADSLIKSYNNYTRLFRFPYLKEGNTPEKVDSIRQILKTHNYRNGYVTIDASDWYIDSRLRKRLKENPNADLEPFKQFYVEHLYERALFYESLSYAITGRHIKHTLLLHHNLAAALFLGDLIAFFKEKGWNIVSAKEAFADPVYERIPKHAGEGLIWALAKDTGYYDEQLRYPAEDSRYEKDRMDELGL